jgi:thiol-disulfide isomerase/thioredoxin
MMRQNLMVGATNMPSVMRRRPSLGLVSLTLVTILCFTGRITTRAAVANGKAFRTGNLDYFDSDTLRYYLGLSIASDDHVVMHTAPPIHDYDVVVLYFAQWDKNSHALAPMFDQIATMLHAAGGNPIDVTNTSIDPVQRKKKEQQLAAAASKKATPVIMALYDCELDLESMVLCNEAGVTHYPTLQFLALTPQSHEVGAQQAHRINQRKKQQQHQNKKKKTDKVTTAHRPAHVTVFGGQWQYGDAILDWIRALVALHQYYRAGGIVGRLRHAVYAWWSHLLPWMRSHGPSSGTRGGGPLAHTLPVGVPSSPSATASRLSSSTPISQTTSSSSAKSARIPLPRKKSRR